MEILNSQLLIASLSAFLITYGFCYLIILNKEKFIINEKNNLKEPQTIHDLFTPRIAGLPIFIGCCVQYLFIDNQNKEFFFYLLICALPVSLIGFCEDITKQVKPIVRLFGSFISGLFFILIVGVTIKFVDISIIDVLLKNYIFSSIITVFAIATLSQAFNIIDGLNGLSAFSFLTILLTISLLSYKIKNIELFYITLYILPVILGFNFLNFPHGKIFLGDGGAYFLGAILSFLLILLLNDSDKVSPLSSLLMVIYPGYEIIRTFFRRIFINKTTPTKPDFKHLHSIIYLHIHSYFQFKQKWKSNSLSCLVTIIFPIITCLWTISFYNSFEMLCLGIITYIISIEILFYYFRNKQQ